MEQTQTRGTTLARIMLTALLALGAATALGASKISELPTGQKVGNILDETLRVGGGATTATTPTLTVPREDASTNTAPPMLRLQRTSSGTPATGIGARFDFEVETSASNNEIGASIEALTTDVTATSEDFDIVFKTMAGGAAAAERARISSTGQVIAGGDGSISAPAFRGTDADSGIYFSSGNVAIISQGLPNLLVTSSTNFRFLPFAYPRPVLARTTDWSPGDFTSGGEVLTNRGATGTVTISPSASTGTSFTFFRVASQAFRIEPGASIGFRRADGTLEANGKYLELGSNGALVTILYDGTEWLVMSERGTINVEP